MNRVLVQLKDRSCLLSGSAIVELEDGTVKVYGQNMLIGIFTRECLEYIYMTEEKAK